MAKKGAQLLKKTGGTIWAQDEELYLSMACRWLSQKRVLLKKSAIDAIACDNEAG
jgi:hypothetical protein